MFHILGILLIIIVVILIIGLSIIGTVVRKIFGLGRRPSFNDGNPSGNNGRPSGSGPSSHQSNPPKEEELHTKRKKLFAQDEGEYVTFEEVKD